MTFGKLFTIRVEYASVQRVQYPCEECGQLFDTKKGLGHRKVHKK